MQKFLDFVANQGFTVFVEVGCFEGDSLAYLGGLLLQKKRPFKIYAVDLWEKVAPYGKTVTVESFQKFQEQTRILPVTAIQEDSTEAAKHFNDGTLDYVFIDASHTYEKVKADIVAWLPKIRPGGMLAGHDYGDGKGGVKRAVDELVQGVEVIGTCWYKMVRQVGLAPT